LLNTAAQKAHLGGPETEEKLLDRQARYLTYHLPGDTEMLRVACDGVIVGSIGYWEIERDGETVYETGWEILDAFQGRGIGSPAAVAFVARLTPFARHRYVLAFPTPQNPGSNGICRKLGFDLQGRPGHRISSRRVFAAQCLAAGPQPPSTSALSLGSTSVSQLPASWS